MESVYIGSVNEKTANELADRLSAYGTPSVEESTVPGGRLKRVYIETETRELARDAVVFGNGYLACVVDRDCQETPHPC